MKQKTVTVNKGLYALFYDTAEDVFAPPAALVSVEPGSSGRLALILEPDASDAVLQEPGSCLVIRATDVGQFRIEMVPARQNGSTAATIKLQMLTKQTGTTKEAHIPAPEPNQSVAADASHADSDKERTQEAKASGRRNSLRRSTPKKAGSKSAS